MNIGVKLLNTCSNSTRIRNCIEDYVASLHPFDPQIGWTMGAINYRYPDKPDDGSTGLIAFDVPGKERMKIRTARYLTRKCKLHEAANLNDEQIRILAEKINNLLWSVEELSDVELIHGPAITKAYEDEVGGSSCMTGSNASYTGLYAANPTRFEMLIIRSGNDSARAIIHKLDDGRKLFGRIYTNAQHLLEKMKRHADDQGWIVSRYVDRSNRSSWIMSNLNYCDGEIPYMDTLISGSTCNGLLTVSWDNGDFGLQDQNGNMGGYICELCGDRVGEEDAYSNDNGNIYCEYCFYKAFLRCEYCEIVIHKDDAVFIEDAESYVCEHCVSSHYYQCEKCQDHYSIDGVQFLNDETYCQNCFGEITSYCEDCDEVFYTEDLTTVDDSGPLCESCATARQKSEGVIK